MKQWFAAAIFVFTVSGVAFTAPKGPEVDLIDNKLSINADAISLGRLLRLFDMATGMTSKVPAELANRNISVKFSGLSLTDGVRKIFQGQPLDYFVIAGKGIVVTALSQTISGSDSVPSYNAGPPQTIEQPFVQDFPPAPGGQFQQAPMVQTPFGPIANPQQQQQQQQQPPMVQTPFGAIPNPRAQQPNTQLNTPGQQNSLFPQTQPFGQPQQAPGAQPSNPFSPTPFAVPSQFGTPNQPQNNPNGLFSGPSIGNPSGIQRVQ